MAGIPEPDAHIVGKSTPSRPADKPKKPYRRFPLFPHRSGQWAKKIRRRLHYFGPWSDAWGALERYKVEADDLHAGRKPRQAAPDDAGGTTVADVVNAFLTEKKRRVAAGEMEPRTFNDYYRTGGIIVRTFGRNRATADLRPDDWSTLRGVFTKGRGATAVSNEIRRTRSIFKWAAEMEVLERPPNFGPEFKQHAAAATRQAKRDKGPLVFSADKIRAILDAAGPQLRGMVLLAINAGLGQSDCSEVRTDHFDLDAAILHYPRPKTGAERRAALWPETVDALRAAPGFQGTTPERRVFVTEHGRPWVGQAATAGANSDAIASELRKLLDGLRLRKRGRSFYSLRRTYQTVAGESLDWMAVARRRAVTRPMNLSLP